MTVSVQTVYLSTVSTCPKMSLLPEHYGPDGTCRCSRRKELLAELAGVQGRMELLQIEAARIREELRSA